MMGACLGKPSTTQQRQRKAAPAGRVSSAHLTRISNMTHQECLKRETNRKTKISRPPLEMKVSRARSLTPLQYNRSSKVTKLSPLEKRSSKMKKLTLEERLLASPGIGLNQDCITNGELYVFKNHSRKKVHPSSSKMISHLDLASKVKDSFCLDQPLGKDKKSSCGGAGPKIGISSMSISEGGRKLTKKVSFSQEPDVIIFYSPEY